MNYAPDDVIESRNLTSKLIWIIIISTFLVSIWSFYTSYELKELDEPAYALAYVSIALGFISVAGVIYSIKTSYDSKTQIIQIANMDFMQILDNLLDDRMNFMYKGYIEELFTWNLQIHLERANELDKKMIKKKYHYRLINSINISLDTLFNRTEWTKLDHDTQANVRQVYKITRQYEKKKEQEKKFKKILERMGKNPNEAEKDFYNRFIKPKNNEEDRQNN